MGNSHSESGEFSFRFGDFLLTKHTRHFQGCEPASWKRQARGSESRLCGRGARGRARFGLHRVRPVRECVSAGYTGDQRIEAGHRNVRRLTAEEFHNRIRKLPVGGAPHYRRAITPNERSPADNSRGPFEVRSASAMYYFISRHLPANRSGVMQSILS